MQANQDQSRTHFRRQIRRFLEALQANPDQAPLDRADELIAEVGESAEGARLMPPFEIKGLGMACSLRLRSPDEGTVEDIGYGPAWKRFLGERTYLAQQRQIRQKLLDYLHEWDRSLVES